MTAADTAVTAGCLDLAEHGEILVAGPELAREIVAAYPRDVHCTAVNAETWVVSDTTH